MNVFGEVRKWFSPKWIKVISIIVKTFLALAVFAVFLFCAIMIYLLIQDYFHDGSDFQESNDVKVEISR